ncbi:MAG: SUMF1/EgtB/PvdO family nonheme iron enzyme [Polyangiaceae bacterium]
MATPDNVRDPFDLIGTTIEGKYRVASVIGDGGFGVVYRGVHTGFGELIAIKCLKIPTNLDEKHREDLLEQLRDEGRLLHKLSKATPGIVQALDVGAMTTPAGAWVPYLVLEWLEGETLAELQRKREEQDLGGMDVIDAIELLSPAARALDVAHQNKIAHRDVKPANLFVTKVGDRRTVKVLDFGIAKVLTDTTITEALAVTRQGPSAFTPRYGAPEQFNKQRGASGPWTDVFALALILVELCTGKRALDGDDPTQLYVASADPTLRPTLRGRGLEVPDAIESVIAKALHVEPKYRYSDAGEMWDALTQAAGLTPEGTRSSQPTVSSGRGRTDTTRASNPDADNLTTGEFAVRASLSVPTEGRPSGPPEPHAATRPAESVFQSGEPPQIVVSTKPDGAGKPASGADVAVLATEPGSAQPASKDSAKSSGRKSFSDDDPMAETPFYARSPQGDTGSPRKPTPAAGSRPAEKPRPAADPTKVSPADPRTTTPASREVPSSAAASSTTAPSSGKGIWFALLGIGAGAALTAYLYFTRPGADTNPIGPGPTHSASASGAPVARPGPTTSASATDTSSASDTASASDSASASGSEPAPPAPPDDMVYIAPMTARLGEGATARQVTLSKGYYIEKREVSSGAYHACVTAGACQSAQVVLSIQRFTPRPAPDGEPDPADTPDAGPSEEVLQYEDTWRLRCTESRGPADHPINCITYAQADAYCKWRKRRLPTEAEWEAAAQGAESRAYPWGQTPPECETACVDKNAQCRGGDVATCATGAHPGDKTPTEVMDLAGNVAEWVADGYLAKPLAGTDPRANPFAKTRVVRGGDFFHNLDYLRSARRREVPPGAAETWIGVRCAMDLPPPP